jgi:alkyl hydroperoxide reductase subunit AhpC
MSYKNCTLDMEIVQEVCDKVANGMNVKAVLESDPKRYPSFKTWCNWKRKNKNVLHLYVCAIQDKAESIDNEIDIAIEDVRAMNLKAAEAKVIIDTLKWKAAKYYPKMFGDRTVIETDDPNERPKLPKVKYSITIDKPK